MSLLSIGRSVGSWWQGDIAYRFRRSPVAILAALVGLALLLAAMGAPVLAPYDAFDPAAANAADARLPPGVEGMFGDVYLLGTDPQGRDMLSAMLYGLRTSLVVGLASVAAAAFAGVLLGLMAGYFGGVLDAFIMRAADVQLSFPAILIALLIDGVARTAMPAALHAELAVPILIAAIAASFWVQYARTVRGLVLVERGRDYVLAAKVTGVSTPRILLTHILPNVLGPVLVIATINLALAILTESTLSFLGVGLPSTQPSLGSLVRIGNEFVFSGDWWISALPGLLLVLLSLSVNIFGDWLRDALNPKLAS
jgi:peptide/nickel transport system permease protein